MSTLKDKDILIIDDAEDIRLLARKILENDGARVHEAADVGEGIRAAHALQPHLILIDLRFPDGSGFDFLSARKIDGQLRAVPAIVLSGANDRASVTQAVVLGTTDYLIKPFRATQLLQKVRKALSLQSFSGYSFPAAEAPEATISVPATIQQLDESGFLIEAAAKLRSDELVRVESDLLRDLGAGGTLTKVATRAIDFGGPGRHVSRLLFTGVGEAFMKKIRKSVGE